jgi:predicted NUDIX family phosphoesterase
MGMGDEILVVKRDVLFKDRDFEGFEPAESNDFMKQILENIEYQVRTNELENDRTWQQPIPYVWLVNPKTKNVFLYKRDMTGNEGRLYNKYSGGVGGHVDKKDIVEGKGDEITQAMMRELEEETIIEEYPTPKIVGYINYNSDVEDVHFGIVAIGETTHDVRPAEDMAHGQFYSIEEVEKIFSNSENDVEKWTIASWPFIKDYLNKLQ